MDVLILSKTHMNGGKCCVGGITDSGRYVRLLTSHGENQPEDTELMPRQIYEIEFMERSDVRPPHVEDIIVLKKLLKANLNKQIKIVDFIKERNIPIWEGNPDSLFNKMIKWTHKGSGYINEEAIPSHSVGFWIPDKNLSKSIYFEKIRYNYKERVGWRSLPYVGFEEAVNTIPKGTLVRVSLARWWDQKGTTELRCPLQLSGWYDLEIGS